MDVNTNGKQRRRPGHYEMKSVSSKEKPEGKDPVDLKPFPDCMGQSFKLAKRARTTGTAQEAKQNKNCNGRVHLPVIGCISVKVIIPTGEAQMHSAAALCSPESYHADAHEDAQGQSCTCALGSVRNGRRRCTSCTGCTSCTSCATCACTTCSCSWACICGAILRLGRVGTSGSSDCPGLRTESTSVGAVAPSTPFTHRFHTSSATSCTPCRSGPRFLLPPIPC